MKGLIEFCKTTAMGGLLVLLPLAVFYLLASEMLGVVVALATPLADFFPESWLTRIDAPVVVALLLMLVASFLFGLALRSRTLTWVGHWLEGAVLDKVPLYGPVKRLSRGLAGAKEEKAFTVAVLQTSDEITELVYVIEESSAGFTTVLVPLAPTGFNGPVKLVRSERVHKIDSSVGEASQVLAQWGVGMQQLVSKQSDRRD